MVALGYLSALLYGVFCLILSLVAYNLGMPKKYTRKIVHIMIGFEWVILYYTVGVSIHFVAVCLLFTALLIISHKKNFMPMISSDGDNALGTVYYGISMTVMAILSLFIDNFVFSFGIAVFCTSIGDGFAGVIGSAFKANNPNIYKNKTLLGTLSAFFFSFISILIFSLIYSIPLKAFHIVAISILVAGLELITEYGLDNITLPLGCAILTHLWLNIDIITSYIVPIVLTPFIIAFALEKKILSKKGVLLAIVLDILISVSLGNFGFVLLLSFLLLSVMVDKIKKHCKKKSESISKKGDHRDAVQVFANGFVPLICAIFYLITEEFIFIIGYNVALAEAFSDTCASGLGSITDYAFDPFKMKKVSVGLSGGMSLPGTLAALISPFIFLLISILFCVLDWKCWLFCSIIAFFGSIIDSFLGSVFQCKFKCDTCGIITEKNIHCEKQTRLISGFKSITNDSVNLISSVISSLIAMFLYPLIVY